MNLNETIMQAVENVLKDRYLIVQATFVNYTPWFGGDYTPDTVKPNGMIALPRAQSLRGKARWLARIAVASFLDNEEISIDGYRACEKAFNNLIGRLFGSTEQAADIMIVFKSGLVKEKIITCSKTKKKAKMPAYWGYGEKLCNMSRIRLLLQSSKKVKFLDRGTVSFTLKLYVRPPARVSASEAAFAAASYLLAPFLLGLGKLTTRGFGRFIIEEYEIGGFLRHSASDRESERKLLNIIENIKGIEHVYEVDKAKENLLSMINNYLDLLRKIVLSYNKSCDRNSKSTIANVRRVPELSKAASMLYLAEINCKDIYCSLLKIGRAVVKNEWKFLVGWYRTEVTGYGKIKKIPKAGQHFHTWVLGLPRAVRGTGYYPAKLGKDLLCIRYIYDKVEKKEHFIVLDSKGHRDVTKDIDKKLRRQSPFVLFPLPQGNLVVILPLWSNDYVKLLEGVGGKRLYHFGTYDVTSNRKLVDAIAVTIIADKERCDKYQRPCSKKKITCGIVYPSKTNKQNKTKMQLKLEDAKNPSDLLTKAYEAAFEFIKKILQP